MLAFVAKHVPGVPVPKVLGFGTYEAELGGCGWMLQELAPGVLLHEAWAELELPARRPYLEAVARVAGCLARIEFAAGGSLVFADTPTPGYRRAPCTWRAGGEELTDEQFAVVGALDHGGAGPASSVAEFMQKAFELLVPELEEQPDAAWVQLAAPLRDFAAARVPALVRGAGGFCLVHSDLHPKNILVDPASGAITAVLDWEWSGPLPSLRERGMLADMDLDDEGEAVLQQYLAEAGVPVAAWRAGAPLYQMLDLAMFGAFHRDWLAASLDEARDDIAANCDKLRDMLQVKDEEDDNDAK